MYALMPITRPMQSATIHNDCTADGWRVLNMMDQLRIGPQAMRNILLTKAIKAGALYVRFVDDDDRLLPHRELAEKALETADVVYFNHEHIWNGQRTPFKFSGDPRADLIHSPAPWCWVARCDVLAKLHEEQPLWDTTWAIYHGGPTWIRFLKAGLKIVHIPVPAYEWHRQTLSVSMVPQSREDIDKWRRRAMEYLATGI
jgi:hypothetical protein